MADRARLSPESETPVNPYSLLEAVNSSSDTAHTGWLIFLAIMTYLMIAVAGVTHEALLLDTPVQLPILQVKIQLKQFFQFAPIVLVLFHLGILAQLVLLARKTLEFDHAIRFLETSDRRTHPLRLELHNFFFVQAIAGPQRSAVMSGFLNIMSWLTIVILPVVLLLYMQVAFLPYHDVTTTWINRIFLSLDIAGILLIGVFLMRAETSFFQAFWRSTFAHPLSSISTTLVLALVAYLSFFAATVPGEPLDRVGQKMMAWAAPDRAGQGAAERLFAAVLQRRRRRHAVRHLPPQPRRHRQRPGARSRRARREDAAPARARSALRQARPHRPFRRRPDRRQPRRRQPHRRQPGERVAELRRARRSSC